MPHARRLAILILLSCALCLAYADRVAFSLAIDPIRSDLHLSDAELGTLGGLAFAVLYALAAIPLARAADRGHRRTVIVAAILLWSALTALTGRSANFLQLFAARVGVGIGEAGAAPASLSLVAGLFPPAVRGAALATCWFGAYLGLVLGLWGGGALVQSLGWRAMFACFALPGLPLALALFAVLPSREGALASSRDQDLLTPWRSPVFRELFLFSATGGFVAWGGLLWDATFYERSFGMTPSEAGFWLGAALGLATAAGTLVGGPIGDRLARGSDHAPLRFAAWSLVASQPFQIACYATGSKTVSLACMVLTTTAGALTVGPVQTALQQSVDERSRATATAFYGIGGSLLGAGLGPPAFGLLSDLLAPRFRGQSLRASLILCAILGFWPALHLFRAARRRPASPA